MDAEHYAPLFQPDPEDNSLKFKKPIKIFYYDLIGSNFVEDEETGYTMPQEEFDIKFCYLHSNAELLKLYERVMSEDLALPVPLELQLMFAFVQALGGYKPKEQKNTHGKQ